MSTLEAVRPDSTETIDPATRLQCARDTVERFLGAGYTAAVFLALREATVGTDFRVGRTEQEDPAMISAQVIRDYIAGLEAAAEEMLELGRDQNAFTEMECAALFQEWRLGLYESMAGQLA